MKTVQKFFTYLTLMLLTSSMLSAQFDDVYYDPDRQTEKTTKYSEDNSNNTTTTTDFYYTPSSRIYTNPYTGHINISLDDAMKKKYAVRFYDPEEKEVLRIARISKTVLILDKNNFTARGTYHFKLFDGTSLVETGYVTIY